MSAELKDLQDTVKKNGEALNTLTKSFNGLMDKPSKTPAGNQPNPSQVFGLPNVRTGENPLSSRGFSFMKMLGMITGAVPPEEAKVEMDIHNRLHNVYVKDLSGAAYSYGGGHRPGEKAFLAPLATGFMHDKIVDRNFRQEMKSLVRAGTEGCDYEEAAWIRRKTMPNVGSKSLSCLS